MCKVTHITKASHENYINRILWYLKITKDNDVVSLCNDLLTLKSLIKEVIGNSVMDSDNIKFVYVYTFYE